MMQRISLNRIAYLVCFVLLFISINTIFAQSKKQQNTWSNKDKKAFYTQHSTDTSTSNELKVCGCMFERIQKKFTSYKQFQLYPNAIIPIEKQCSSMVYVPITGQLSSWQAEIISNEMLFLLNNFRKENGVIRSLKPEKDLDKAAKIQADYCAWNRQLSHTQVGNNEYSTVNKRISMVKNKHSKGAYLCGENIAETFYESAELNDTSYLKNIAKDLMELWASSEGHRENMLYKDYRFFGFAITFNAKEEELYATQVFCY